MKCDIDAMLDRLRNDFTPLFEMLDEYGIHKEAKNEIKDLTKIYTKRIKDVVLTTDENKKDKKIKMLIEQVYLKVQDILRRTNIIKTKGITISFMSVMAIIIVLTVLLPVVVAFVLNYKKQVLGFVGKNYKVIAGILVLISLILYLINKAIKKTREKNIIEQLNKIFKDISDLKECIVDTEE